MKTLKEILADRRSENEKIIRAAQSRVEEVLLAMCYGMLRLRIADNYFHLKIAEGEEVEVYPDKIRVYTEDRHRSGETGCFEWENAEVFHKLLEWELVEMDNSMSVLDKHPLLGFAERLEACSQQ